MAVSVSPPRTAADYRAQLLQLLPPGPAWDAGRYPVPGWVAAAAAQELARIDTRAANLLDEMFPGAVAELLPDWERAMALPDACMGAASSTAERRREVARRFSQVGRQDAAYFEGIARDLGYPAAKVHEWRAPRFGHARFGRAHFGAWSSQFVWVLALGAHLAGGTRFGATNFWQRFAANPNDIVECVVRRYAPAHTLVFFTYS